MRAIVKLTFVLGAVLAVGACGGSTAPGASAPPAVTIQKTEGNPIARLTLSDRAAERLGITVAAVTQRGASSTLEIPYSSVLYASSGETWAYTNPEKGVFVRAPITVDRIEGNVALLSAGPPVGTSVVTVGAAELYGAENGVGGGH